MMRYKPIILALAILAGVGILTAVFLPQSEADNPSPGTSPGADNTTDATIDKVGVAGSNAQFPVAIESSIGGKKEKLTLTGTALRKKVVFNVYSIGSYLQNGVTVTSAEELCSKDCCKQLHLVMEHTISGKQMAEALTDAIRKNYPKPEFDAEIAALSKKLQPLELTKGAQVWLTNVPGSGLNINVVGMLDCQIEGTAFAKAIWEIYLGKKNLGEPIKAGLISRLK